MATASREPVLNGSASVPSVVALAQRGPTSPEMVFAGSSAVARPAAAPAAASSSTLAPGASARAVRSPSPQPQRGQAMGHPTNSYSPAYAALSQPSAVYSYMPATMPAASSQAVAPKHAVVPTGGWWDECLGSPGPPPGPQRPTSRHSLGARPSSLGAAVSPGTAGIPRVAWATDSSLVGASSASGSLPGSAKVNIGHGAVVTPSISVPPSPRSRPPQERSLSLSSVVPTAQASAGASLAVPAAGTATGPRWNSPEGPATARLSARTQTPASSPASGRAALTPPMPGSSFTPTLENQQAAKTARRGWGPPTPPREHSVPPDGQAGRFVLLPDPPGGMVAAATAPAATAVMASASATVQGVGQQPALLGLQAVQAPGTLTPSGGATPLGTTTPTGLMAPGSSQPVAAGTARAFGTFAVEPVRGASPVAPVNAVPVSRRVASPAPTATASAISLPLATPTTLAATASTGAASSVATMPAVVRGRTLEEETPKGPELVAYPPEPGAIPADGEWSPRDSVWKRYFSTSGLLAQEEPLLYSTTASTFVTPRPFAKQASPTPSEGPLGEGLQSAAAQSTGALPVASDATVASLSVNSSAALASQMESSMESSTVDLEAATRAISQMPSKAPMPALPRLQMPHRDGGNLDIALGAPVSLERAGDDFGLGIYSASSLAVPMSPSESLAGSSVASTILRNHSGGSGYGGGFNAVAHSTDNSARISEPPGSISALQASMEELRSAKAAQASAKERWPSRRGASRQNSQASAPGFQAPPPPASVLMEDSGPEQEPSPTMRHLRDLAPPPAQPAIQMSLSQQPAKQEQERAPEFASSSAPAEAHAPAASGTGTAERRPRSRQSSLGASSAKPAADRASQPAPQERSRASSRPGASQSRDGSNFGGSRGPSTSPSMIAEPPKTSGSLRGLVGRFGPPPSEAGSPPPATAFANAGFGAATASASASTSAGATFATSLALSPGAAASSMSVGVGLDLEGLTPLASPSPGAATVLPSSTPVELAASTASQAASGPPSRQWSRSEVEEPLATHTSSSLIGSVAPSSTTSPLLAQGTSGTTSGSAPAGLSGGAPRPAAPRARSRGSNSLGNSNEEEKVAALLAFKEQVAASSASEVSTADWAAAEVVAAQVTDAARAVIMRDLGVLKVLRSPPAVVIEVVDAVVAVLGLPESGWTQLRRKLDQQFLQRVLTFDANQAARLPRLRVERFQRLLQAPAFGGPSSTASNTTAALAALQDKCPAVAPLARWCTMLGQLLLRLHGDLLHGTGPDGSAVFQEERPRRPSRQSRTSPSPPTPATTAPSGIDASGAQAGMLLGTAPGADVSAGGWEAQPSADTQLSSVGGGSGRSGPSKRPSGRGPAINPSPSPETTPEARPPDMGGLEVEPELWKLNEGALANVSDLRVGRRDVGSVTFHGVTDCRGLLSQLPELLVIEQGEVVVYPDPRMKPPVGEGLNKPASVVLYGCMPKSQQRLSDPRAREKYRQRVAQMTEEKGAVFEDYDCEDGTWKFRVLHF